MSINLSRLNDDVVTKFVEEGKWYNYKDGVDLKIRPLYGKIIRAVDKECQTISGGEIKTNEKKKERMLRQHMVADWKGIEVNDAKAEKKATSAKPTIENITSVFDYVTPLARFITDTAGSAGQEIEEYLEGKRENF